MKYMHFRASCSFAALAEIMESYGVDAEDYSIAMEMKLPWLFTKEDDTYVCGINHQGAKWFDLWLMPRGFRMEETAIDKSDICDYLKSRKNIMLGIKTEYGKHAVVLKSHDGEYHFFNPVHEGSDQPVELIISERGLLDSVDDTIMVGGVVRTNPETVDMKPLLMNSIGILNDCIGDVEVFAKEEHSAQEYALAMDRLFRPLLLDGITMLELAGEESLAVEFRKVQKDFLSFMRGPKTCKLMDYLSLERLHAITMDYANLIEKQIV